MFAADFLIERLLEQKELAASMTENPAAGGSVEQMCERLKEGSNRAHHIPMLQAVEGGARRYGKHFRAALEQVEKLGPIFAGLTTARGAPYHDELQRGKAMARFKDTPKAIADICDGAIKELDAALKILEEGERKEAKLAAAK